MISTWNLSRIVCGGDHAIRVLGRHFIQRVVRLSRGSPQGEERDDDLLELWSRIRDSGLCWLAGRSRSGGKARVCAGAIAGSDVQAMAWATQTIEALPPNTAQQRPSTQNSRLHNLEIAHTLWRTPTEMQAEGVATVHSCPNWGTLAGSSFSN